MQFHGDLGLGARSRRGRTSTPTSAFAAYGGASEPIPYDRPAAGIDFGLALRELDAAIREDRPHAASAERAAHVVEVMCAIRDSAELGRAVELQQPPQRTRLSAPSPRAGRPRCSSCSTTSHSTPASRAAGTIRS